MKTKRLKVVVTVFMIIIGLVVSSKAFAIGSISFPNAGAPSLAPEYCVEHGAALNPYIDGSPANGTIYYSGGESEAMDIRLAYALKFRTRRCSIINLVFRQ